MIFLFKIDEENKGLNFVINEGIARDMSPELEVMLGPLVNSTCKVLEHYKIYSNSNPIIQCQFIESGELEINLSPGLGQYIDPYTKNQILFENAKLISDILVMVMNRKS